MNAKALELQALHLPTNERAKLALDLIESLESLSVQEVAKLWESECTRRAAQVDGGDVVLVSSEIVATRTAELLK